MSNTRNQCDGVGHATRSAIGLDRDFAQLTQSYQAHGGEVNTGTTPQVQYSYADGSSNTIRITGMTYPNGRNLMDDYGTTGGMNDAASRIFGMKDSGASSNLVEYSYLGLSGFVKTVYPESSAQYTMIGTTGGTNPDSGDIYLGLDRFGRVIDANWANVPGTATLARVKYGYNRVSSRTWRDNLSPGMTGYDELYGYDQLQRLENLGRGTLNGTQTAITSPTFGQNWTLDETGNWNGFKQSDNGSTWPLDQTRTANTVNEITTMTNTTSKAWTTPAYDAAGNMTRIPVPGTLPDGVAWNTMSLSEWDNLKLADWDEMTLDNVEAVYDAWNLLVRLHVGDTTLAVYAYDARGYRIRKDNYSSGTLTEARHYYYTPGWQVVEERIGSSTTADRQFVWGLRYVDDLVLRDRDTDGNGTLDERRYCLQDGNWNVIAIANTSGTVTERFSYDAYGVPTFLTSSGTVQASSPAGWETLYAGYRWDGDPSKMYYVRNRLLLPFIGIWNRRDPIGYYSNERNLFIYGNKRQMSATDPSGLILIVIDGTGSKEFADSDSYRNPRTRRPLSHARNFHNDYITADGESKWYLHGPKDKTSGYDCRSIQKQAMTLLEPVLSRYSNDEPIRLVGHSRGGYVAIEVARELQSKGHRVDFLGLYDAVDSAPGYGEAETIPSNVRYAAHAMGEASVNSRTYFNTADHGPELSPLIRTYKENTFLATHGGLGGAPWMGDIPSSINRNIDTAESSRADAWMRTQALNAGVELRDTRPQPESESPSVSTLQEIERHRSNNKTLLDNERCRVMRGPKL